MDQLQVLANKTGAPHDKVLAIYNALSNHARSQEEAYFMTRDVILALWGKEA